jgi:dTDP-4-amino-4,6-dideoxy-D-galactose acyltransferase
MLKNKLDKLGNSMKNFSILNWDSDLFGYTVAKIHLTKVNLVSLEGVISSLKSNKVRLAYLFLDHHDPSIMNAIERFNGRLVDKKTTYMLGVTNPKLESNPNIFSYLNSPITKQLSSLSLQSGEYSRFNIDNDFKQGEFEKLYSIWLDKSVKGEIAKDIFVYKENGCIVGFITIEIKDDKFWIGLLAVDKQYRGQSIGAKLINRCVEEAQKMRYNTIWVNTQGDNIVACRFYEKMGFKLINTQYIYHFWL